MLEFAKVDLEGIRAKLGEPDGPTTQKITDYLDDNCLAFLAHSPFCTLATVVLAALVLRERLSPLQITGIALAIAACVALALG